ncbi:MAG: hypothetical protein IJJ42_03955 [Clostridia bacterium]|nr:hypothetical protein [Clostridia bacterium]
MKTNRSAGGWLPFMHKDDPLVPGQKDDNVFSKEGIIVFIVILVVLIVVGMIGSHFFGPHPKT